MFGCGDTEKRTAGKKLRSATREAKKHYDKAQSILSNYNDGYNNSEVLSELDAAEKLLADTLRENNSDGDTEDVPYGELVNARTMLGMVYRLRGMRNLLKIDAVISEVGIQEYKTYLLLTRAQALRSGVVSCEQSLLDGTDNIDGSLSKARTDQKTLTGETGALNSRIKTQTEKIQALEEKTRSLSVKSARLRKESAVDVSHEGSLRKLREAQSVEKEIIDNEAILAQQQRDLSMSRNKAVILQIKLEELNGKIKAGEARNLSVENAEKRRKADLTSRENKIKTCWENIVVSQKSLAENSQLVMKLTARVVDAFGKAKDEFASAWRIDRNASARLINDQADALVGQAEAMTRLMNLHGTIKRLSDRIQSVRENMGDMQVPVSPVAPEITKFLAESGGLASKITDSRRQAIRLRESLARQPRKTRSTSD